MGLALGAYLIARGDLIVGVLVGGSAVLRTVYLLSVSRAWNRRANQPAGPRDPNQVRRLLRGLAHNAFEIAGGVVGVNPVELRRGFQQGRSIAEAAAARGVPVDAVIRAVVDDAVRLARPSGRRRERITPDCRPGTGQASDVGSSADLRNPGRIPRKPRRGLTASIWR